MIIICSQHIILPTHVSLLRHNSLPRPAPLTEPTTHFATASSVFTEKASRQLPWFGSCVLSVQVTVNSCPTATYFPVCPFLIPLGPPPGSFADEGRKGRRKGRREERREERWEWRMKRRWNGKMEDWKKREGGGVNIGEDGRGGNVTLC